MRRFRKGVMVGVAAILALTTLAGSKDGDNITLPWSDFKNIYQEHIRREIKRDEPKEKVTPILSLDTSLYDVIVKEKYADVNLSLTGSVVQGGGGSVPVLASNTVITGKPVLENIKLHTYDDLIVGVIPTNKPFKLQISFIVPLNEDNTSRFVEFETPTCLSTKLTVKLPDHIQLLEAPGIRSADGIYHLNGGKRVKLRIQSKDAIPEKRKPDFDTFTLITLDGEKLLATTFLKRSKVSANDFTMTIPKGFRFLGSNLRRSWYTLTPTDQLVAKLPSGYTDLISVEMAADLPEKQNQLKLNLPQIAGNLGRQGEFTVMDSIEAEVKVSGDGLVKRNSPKLFLDAGTRRQPFGETCWSIPSGKPVDLAIRRLQALATPDVVLDRVCFFTAFEENGRALSVLRFDLPAEADSRLYLNRIPDAEIWYVKVNGAKEKVFSLNDKQWVVQLGDRQGQRSVELAFLRRSEKMGLQGELKSILPATGITARKLYYAVAIPEKYELLTLDGPVSPTDGKGWQTPKEFIGRRYYFASSFYQGKEIQTQIFYREPAEEE